MPARRRAIRFERPHDQFALSGRAIVDLRREMPRIPADRAHKRGVHSNEIPRESSRVIRSSHEPERPAGERYSNDWSRHGTRRNRQCRRPPPPSMITSMPRLDRGRNHIRPYGPVIVMSPGVSSINGKTEDNSSARNVKLIEGLNSTVNDPAASGETSNIKVPA